VSGCPNQCGESFIKDLGFIGKAKGWTIVVGGNAASRPRLAEKITENVSTEEALAISRNIMTYFKENGKKGERIGRFIDRIGFENFQTAVLS
jgi:NAD(P)H-nitrite reductase large subunit